MDVAVSERSEVWNRERFFVMDLEYGMCFR